MIIVFMAVSQRIKFCYSHSIYKLKHQPSPCDPKLNAYVRWATIPSKFLPICDKLDIWDTEMTNILAVCALYADHRIVYITIE